jgi:hypothetical protein
VWAVPGDFVPVVLVQYGAGPVLEVQLHVVGVLSDEFLRVLHSDGYAEELVIKARWSQKP